MFYIHRLMAAFEFLHLTDEQPEVDHIDGDRTNNHFTNLRPASSSQQSWNTKMKKSNTSRHKGVYWNKKANKWMARITYKGKRFYLGCFDDYDEACRVRDAKELELFGEWITDR